MRTKLQRLGIPLLAAVALLTCAAATPGPQAQQHPSPQPQQQPSLQKLINPPRDYLGVAVEGVPKTTGRLHEFSRALGKTPNLIEYYAAFGDKYEPVRTRNAHDNGALTLITWEPYKAKLKDITAGRYDAYIRKFATSVRDAKMPIALSFGHEMNGFWYPWDTRHNSPQDYVDAWRHLHDVFDKAGAHNVIWTWAPNQVGESRISPLAPVYPGDDYVDWVGVVGYFVGDSKTTLAARFDETFRQLRDITDKPVLISETGVAPRPERTRIIRNILKETAESQRIIGLVQFEYDVSQRGRSDWRILNDPAATAAFREGVADPRFGFDIRTP